MNVFLTSIMHPETARDYKKVLENFNLSMQSVCGQKDRDFKVVVVCNEVPKIEFKHDNIIYHVVDFYPAEKDAGIFEKRKDKAAKLLAGLVFLKSLSPKFVYIFDADDWLSNQLNGFLHSADEDLCYFSNKGYLVDIVNKVYLVKYGLFSYCGSTHALPYRIFMNELALPDTANVKDKDAILSHVSENMISSLFGGHAYCRYFELRGIQSKPFPFASVAWLRNTGNNIRVDAQDVPGLALTYDITDGFLESSSFSLEPKRNSLKAYINYKKYAALSWLRYQYIPDHKSKLEF